MKNMDLINVWQAINNVAKIETGSLRYKWAIAKNLNKARREIEALEPLINPAAAYVEFAEKVRDKGNIEALKIEYADAIAIEDKRRAELPDLLKAESDFTPHMIPASLIPDEISPRDMAILWELWADDMGEGE